MKKHKVMGLVLTGALLSGAAAIAAEAGSSGDPLVSLNWLQTVFVPQAVSSAQTRIEEKTEEIYQSVVQGQNTQSAEEQELRLKRGDRLALKTGAVLIPLDGSLTVEIKGAAVDLTAGTEVRNTLTAERDHRYLIAENSTAMLTVTTDTAVIRTGDFQLTPSNEVDYYKLADALRTMGLFRGTGTPYGFGYDLEKVPTRIEGLVMFLRLIGEEQAALQYKGGSQSFSDVPGWAMPYAVYAYDKGYTKGTGTDEQGRIIFGTQNIMSANEYVTFLLRALHYQESVDFNWNTAVKDGEKFGVLTPGESAFLLTGDHFHRAQVAYLSYVGLSAKFADGGGTLLDRLLTTGAVPAFADAGLTRM